MDACRTIEASNGTIRYDDQNRPVAIDLVTGRGSVNIDTLESILLLRDLRSLKMRCDQLHASQIARLSALQQLRELVLQDAAIDDTQLANILLGCTNLERLTLRRVRQISDTGLANLVRVATLTHLSLIEMPLSSETLTAVAKFSALESLDLRMSNAVDALSLSALRDMRRLRDLKLAGQNIDNDCLKVIAAIPRLECLTIEDASIDGNALTQLANTGDAGVRIRSLTLSRSPSLGDEDLRSLAGFTNLRHLVLRDLPVTGSFLTTLDTKDNLESLALNQTFLSEEAFAEIAKCRGLKRLELSHNFLSPLALKKIGHLENLEHLNLSHCALADEQLAALSSLTQLRTLNLDGNPGVSQEMANALHTRF